MFSEHRIATHTCIPLPTQETRSENVPGKTASVVGQEVSTKVNEGTICRKKKHALFVSPPSSLAADQNYKSMVGIFLGQYGFESRFGACFGTESSITHLIAFLNLLQQPSFERVNVLSPNVTSFRVFAIFFSKAFIPENCYDYANSFPKNRSGIEI